MTYPHSGFRKRKISRANFNVILIVMILLSVITSCRNKTNYDASGTFEADETIISAEANGALKTFSIEEGQVLQAGQQVGYIDTIQLVLKKKQLESQVKATGSRLPDIPVQTYYFKQQMAVTQSRLDNLRHEQKRIENLVKADAATAKQLDDINAQIDETEKQLAVTRNQDAAQSSVLKTQAAGLRGDVLPLIAQIEQVNDQLAKSVIVNPLNGTVLTKYAEAYEVVSTGKQLYKIADLSTLILRAYVTGDQLPQLKINQKVTAMIDSAVGKYKNYEGVIEWISDKAEFTPKTIQTKEERANLVYAVKIRVKNDGYLKIGMYGEVKL